MNIEILAPTQEEIDELNPEEIIMHYKINGGKVQTEYFSGEWTDCVDDWTAFLIQFETDKQEAERTYKTHYLPFLNN